jgi:SAM-dependent methyltransferase
VISDEYFERFNHPKYRARNPIKRALIRRFAARVLAAVRQAGPVTAILEVGIGEGFLSGHLSAELPEVRFAGVDASAAAVAHARKLFPAIDARLGDAYDLADYAGQFDFVLCAEVLEHLDDPRKALGAIAALGPRRALFTVPHEPFFRLSNLAAGKNVRHLGNDPEHVQQFGRRSLRSLLSGPFEVLSLGTSFPWILAMTAPRSRTAPKPGRTNEDERRSRSLI